MHRHSKGVSKKPCKQQILTAQSAPAHARMRLQALHVLLASGSDSAACACLATNHIFAVTVVHVATSHRPAYFMRCSLVRCHPATVLLRWL